MYFLFYAYFSSTTTTTSPPNCANNNYNNNNNCNINSPNKTKPKTPKNRKPNTKLYKLQLANITTTTTNTTIPTITTTQLYTPYIVGYTMRDIRYKWNEGPNSVGVSSEVSLPQFKVLGHRQRAMEISLTTGTCRRLPVFFKNFTFTYIYLR